MKKSFGKKALCIALASAMLFAGAPSVMAADTQVTGYTEEQAATASVEASIIGTSLERGTVINSACLNLGAGGTGDRVEFLVNGLVYAVAYGDSYSGEWHIDSLFYGKAGASYKFTLVVYGSDGSKITKDLGTKKFVTPVFGKDIYSTGSYTDFSGIPTGYNKINGIRVYANFAKTSLPGFCYRVLRSTKQNGPYSVVGTGEMSGNAAGVSYNDTSAKLNCDYYYKYQIITGTDKYIKTSKVVATSPVIKADAALGKAVYVDAECGSKGVDITVDSRNIEYNQFDLYRSTSKTKGYRKIKTLTTDYKYTDTTAKAGVLYYYKAVPKYYDIKTEKLVAGPSTKPQGIKLELGNTEVTASQVSASAAKLSWGRTRGANVYEVWMRNDSISGDSFHRVATTKDLSVTVRGLETGSRYQFIVKSQCRSNGNVICENHSGTYLTVGFVQRIEDFKVLYRTSTANAAKTSIAVTTAVSWRKVWGATGYKIMAYNRYTNKLECVATLRSASTVTYKFRNPGSKAKGIKYTWAYVVPYRGSLVGDESQHIAMNIMPMAKNVKAGRLSNSQVKVTWSAVAGADSYTVTRTFDKMYSSYASNDVSGTSYVDEKITTGTVYKYVVRACAGIAGMQNSADATDSEIGRTGSARYVHKVGTPKIATAENTAAGTATLTWKKISLAKYYIVYRSTQKNGTYSKIGSTVKLTYADKKAVKGKTYYYKVKAVSIGDNGVVSTSASSPVAYVKSTK